ncbi:MAG TPA: CoA pyrophosphatase [Candidatus Binatia bacterium]|nr:CoA pyrophosphatase [Candidatus Binatia bacterium]
MTESTITALAGALGARPRRVLTPPGKTVAAVLVPLLAVDGEPSLLFTRRSSALPHHQGQVAFPGGRHHPGEDADLAATALREADEEIGLAPADVRLLGALDDIETVSTRFVITPFVGVAPWPYPFRPCPREVDAIFTVPLAALLAPDALRRETWDFGGRAVPIDTYPVDGHVIWGATQRITRDLLAILRDVS